MTVSVLMEAIRADLPFYEESGGGVTFSGGEPLAQREFILALLKACKSEGIHSALDTSGFTDRDFMLEAGMLTDIVLFDLKLLDEEKHRKFTGVSNTSILTNLSALYEAGANVVLRLPLIPGINDALEELEKMALYIGSLEAKPTELRSIEIRHTDKKSIETGPISDTWSGTQTKFLPKKAHILPYHDSAKDKYRLRRQEYAMSGTAIPSTESIDRAVSIFEAAGISVTIGG
jgi:pyruvate formate lyase activating enzyme